MLLSQMMAVAAGNSAPAALVQKQIFLTNTALTSWSVPDDWNNDANKIECWGGGDKGVASSGGNAKGGNGGDYAAIDNFQASAGSSIEIQIASDGSTDTWFDSVSTVLAKSGKSSSTSVGTTVSSGGLGGSGSSGYGGGGGGSAGPDGDGKAGSQGSFSGGGKGGAGDNALGGVGGSGKNDGATAGSGVDDALGGGGGGGAGFDSHGGAGGTPGGGGGGVGNGTVGPASPGQICITYMGLAS